MPMPDSIQDDIRSALASSTDGQKPNGETSTGVDDFGSPPSEVLPPVFPEGKGPAETKEPSDLKSRGPLRGPDGKFQPAQPQAPQPQAPAAPQPLGSQPQTPADDSMQFDPAKPPAGWRPEMKAKWDKIPQDVREEITRREQDTAIGVQKLQNYYAPAAYVYQAVQPYAEYLQYIKEDPQIYMDGMFRTEQTLRLGNPAQKIELLLSLADTYGVPIRGALDQAMGGKLGELMIKAHEHHKTPPVIPAPIAREYQQLKQFKEQVEDQAAENELSTFATEPGHDYLEYVREDMANLIEGGYAETYQDAYDLACWRNPQIRPYYMQASAGNAPPPVQQPQTVIQQRQAQAAAIVAPGSAPLEYGEDRTNDNDDIHEAVKKAWIANTGRT